MQSGTYLFAAGSFHASGAKSLSRYLAQWDGTQWIHTLDSISKPDTEIRVLTLYRGDLIVSGAFDGIGGDTAYAKIASFTGVGFNPMTLPSPVGGGYIFALQAYGDDLYAGGSVDHLAATDAGYLARWDGAAWSAVPTPIDNTIFALSEFGGKLYLGGKFNNVGGDSDAKGLAEWDGTTMSRVGAGTDKTVYGIGTYNGQLAIGGTFSSIGAVSDVHKFGYFDGTTWHGLNASTPLSSRVNAMATYNGTLFAGGKFEDVNGVPTANLVAQFSGGNWLPVGTHELENGGNNGIEKLISFDGKLYALGSLALDIGGGSYIDSAIYWNGTQWQGLGDGLNSTAYDGLIAPTISLESAS
jgi:hypothetical protein